MYQHISIYSKIYKNTLQHLIYFIFNLYIVIKSPFTTYKTYNMPYTINLLNTHSTEYLACFGSLHEIKHTPHFYQRMLGSI